MNLEVARRVLEVSEAQPYGFVKLRGRGIGYDVKEMENASLLVLSAAQTNELDLAIIKGVTSAGRRLLGVLRDKATALCLKQTATSSGVLRSEVNLEMALL
jgi:hypothetical protein